MDVNNMSERWTHGKVGLSALTKGGPSTRFQARNAVDALLGPSMGTAVDMAQIFGSSFHDDGMTKKDLHVIRTMIPFNQVFYLRQAIDQVEGEFAKPFPETRR